MEFQVKLDLFRFSVYFIIVHTLSNKIILKNLHIKNLMKAIILVGGYGTRMRPLTATCPKSVLPFMNKPMVEHQVEALAKVGVKEIILAINYLGDIIKKDLQQIEQKYNIKLSYSQQPQPLGTAGPIKFSKQLLLKDNQTGLIFVLNSDIVCDFPLAQLLEFHKVHGKQASIVLSTVSDPSRYGVVVANQQNRIEKFVEKPKQYISNKINAGIYVLNTSVIDLIPDRFCMIEKEIFPKLAEQGQLYAYTLKNNFWFDLGIQQDYLNGQGAFLQYYGLKAEGCQGGCLIDPSAKIGPECKIGPNVVIGPNCVIGAGCRLKNCSIYSGTVIGNGCLITNSVVSWKCKIGGWVRIEQMSAVAEDVNISEECRLSHCKVLSHKNITSNHEKEILM